MASKRKYYTTVEDAPDKRSKRRKIIGRSFLVWSGGLFLILIVIIGAFYFLIYGSLFKVRDIEITGTKLFNQEELMSFIIPNAIPKYPARVLFSPRHMLFWQLAKGNKLSVHGRPIFHSVIVNTDWRSRTVRIDVKERQFFGIWCANKTPSNDCFAFDNEGVIFGPAPLAEGSLLLKVTSENNPPTYLGGRILPSVTWVSSMLQTIKIIEASNKNVKSILIKDYALEEWEARLAEGPRLLFSFRLTSSHLSGLLDNLEKRFDLKNLEYIDFRVENRVFYK